MRKPTLVATVLSLCACSPEDLAALQERQSEEVTELSHVVRVRFEDGASRLTVSRTFRNDTAEYQVLLKSLSLPTSAIATSLRVGVDGAWPVASTLSSKEDATARWDALTSPGEAAPSTLAKLEWGFEGGVQLDLFGMPPGATVNVEYDVELEPVYSAGELSFEYPRDEADLPPQFELASGTLQHVSGEIEDSEETSTGFRVHTTIHFEEAVAARWATYPLELDRSLWRFEVDVAPQLGHAPVRPNVVFVVDASHSEGPEGIASQLELIAPYLENARDAQVEIVVYRRFAERLFGRFEPAGEVARLLAATPAKRLAPGNGSNLDLGAALAADALAQAGGIGRMVIFTDEATRFGFSNEATSSLLSTAPKETVVHVVARSGSTSAELSESRDDEAELAPLAAAHGGIFLRVDGHPGDPVLAADTLLGLIRPVRIDAFAVEAPGLEDELVPDSELPEGSSVRLNSVSASPPDELILTGKIWAKDFKRVVELDPRLSNRLPGIWVGDDEVRSELSDDELRTVAFVSHAVSPVTSFLSIPGGASPSTAGSYGSGVGCLGMKGNRCGDCIMRSSCVTGGPGSRIDYAALLRVLLAPGVAACEQQHSSAALASVKLEATADEVVFVEVSSAAPMLSECLTEAAWAIRLGSQFVGHRVYEVNELH